MRDLLEEGPSPEDAHAKAQAHARKALPKRFYKSVTVEACENGFTVLLDGRSVRTPAKTLIEVPTKDLADAMAAEWAAQGEKIDPAKMPVTRLVNSALDGVSVQIEAVRAEIVKYAGSDLVCYRADGPDSLVEAQCAAWDPVVAFAADRLGARFELAGGIAHVQQADEALAAVAGSVAEFDLFRLSALHVITTLTGSALIALALAQGVLTAEAAFNAAHVDELWNAERWGSVPEAEAQRATRHAEMMAAARVILGRVP
ncbi:MAG: ATPase [Hyphomicrobiales bacterium]|nr:MAG: ATPase [Hyphomicrobiales bacterium]